MKSEPDAYGIDDLRREGSTLWDGIRNYQARNFMRDDMKIGDRVLFYHSNTKPPGVAGIAQVCRESYPDYFAQDPESKYFDPKSTPEKPIWMMVDVKFISKFDHYVSRHELQSIPELADMKVLEKGSRLSITPIEKHHFEIIKDMGTR